MQSLEFHRNERNNLASSASQTRANQIPTHYIHLWPQLCKSFSTTIDINNIVMNLRATAQDTNRIPKQTHNPKIAKNAITKSNWYIIPIAFAHQFIG